MTAKINPALLAQIAAGASLKTDTTVSDVCDIPLHQISSNPHQPRLDIDAAEVRALAESIRIHGLIQPIAVVRSSSGYVLVSGHSRLEAHKIIGRDTIRANIIEASDDDLAVLALIENVQRSDLHPLEVALAISKEPFLSMKDEEIAEVLGYSVTKLRNTRSILNLSDQVQWHITKHRPKIGVDILVEIQKLYRGEQYWYYGDYIEGKIKREDIRAAIRAQNPRETPKPSSPISRLGSGYKIDCSAVSDTMRESFEGELSALLEKYTKDTK